MVVPGRKDKTLVRVNLILSYTKEEQIVVLSEPGSKYIDHITPNSGKAVDITNELMKIGISSESVTTLDIVGVDGTAVNTGCANGIIRLLVRVKLNCCCVALDLSEELMLMMGCPIFTQATVPWGYLKAPLIPVWSLYF